jgi:hypothetical protein
MANRYWVGGGFLGEWTPTNRAPWRTTPGASFSGIATADPGVGSRITFTNLKGLIANTHYLYNVTFPGFTARIASAITYTNSPANTEGYFAFTSTNTVLLNTELAICAHSSDTGVDVPTSVDSVYLDAGSAYIGQEVKQSGPRPGSVTILDLNMNGFRGTASLGQQFSISYALNVRNSITWPYNTGADGYALISLLNTYNPAGTTIINNGNTLPTGFLAGVEYRISGFTPPVNIIAAVVILNGTINLSDRTIISKTIFANESTSVITPGTSTLITNTYVSNDNTATNTINNVIGLSTNTASGYSVVNTGLIHNTITILQTPPESLIPFSSSFDVDAPCTYNNLNMQFSDLVFIDSSIKAQDTVTLTKSISQGVRPYMLQVREIQNVNFSPTRTAFVVGADFNSGRYTGTNIRPSPNPLNFL